MRINKKIAALIAVPALVIGWALFRPELLFINQKVDEKLPVSSGKTAMEAPMTVSSGEFSTYAHDTMGKAEIVESAGKHYVRLTNFETSNGPDVHVLLVKGMDSSDKGVNMGGTIDLGSLKGNIGDQNYEIPASANLDEFQAVTIWCSRFKVAFGGATLAKMTS